MANGHLVNARTAMDVNLAKQLNILLGQLGVKDSQILVDPTTGGLGYGLEYSYSVMERLRMAAMAQGDDKLQGRGHCQERFYRPTQNGPTVQSSVLFFLLIRPAFAGPGGSNDNRVGAQVTSILLRTSSSTSSLSFCREKEISSTRSFKALS